jgi:drug/metabolite transporter (DMT)-like permease
MNRSLGLAAGIAVVVLWASAFPAIRVAAPAFGAVGLSLARLAVASAALLALAWWTRPRLPRLRDVPLISAAAFCGMTAYQLLLNEAERTVPAGTASLVISAAPLVSLAVAVLFLGERLTVAGAIGSLVALAGVTVVSLARAGISFGGAIALVVAATVVQGLYHPLIKPLLNRYSSLEVATYTMIAGTVMTLPLLPWGWPSVAAAGTGAWLSAIYLGLLPSALGFVLWGIAVRALPVAASTSLLYLVPGVAVLIAYLWLGELPTPGEALGGLVIVAGVILLTKPGRLAHRHHRALAPSARPGVTRQHPDRIDQGSSPALTPLQPSTDATHAVRRRSRSRRNAAHAVARVTRIRRALANAAARRSVAT